MSEHKLAKFTFFRRDPGLSAISVRDVQCLGFRGLGV